MVWFVLAIIVGVVMIAAAVTSIVSKDLRPPAVITAVISAVVAVGLMFAATAVSVDEGSAKVLRSATGKVEGTITEAGFSFKAPWQTALNYDIRNQQVKFQSVYDKGTKQWVRADGADGAEITVRDKDGVTNQIDISVRYSIDPGSVADVYKEYGSAEKFIDKFIKNDISAGVRTIPTEYGTLTLQNKRAEVEDRISNYLKKRWEKAGVRAESVSLQDIRPPKSVQDAFAEAQNARTNVERAEAELRENEVKAKSNEVLAKSLKSENLEQLKWDTLREIGKKGNLIVVPENFNGMLNIPNGGNQ